MRFIAISDTHFHASELPALLLGAGDFDLLVHLGDGTRDLRDAQRLFTAKMMCVRGNNDFSSDNLPESLILEIGGERIYCCHGHTLDVRTNRAILAATAKRAGCSIALYGHTHVACDETIFGVRCLNPGSIGYPEGKRGYIAVSDEGGKVSVEFCEI